MIVGSYVRDGEKYRYPWSEAAFFLVGCSVLMGCEQRLCGV